MTCHCGHRDTRHSGVWPYPCHECGCPDYRWDAIPLAAHVRWESPASFRGYALERKEAS